MTDPYCHHSASEPIESEHTFDYSGYTICLRQTGFEWMAVITRPAERPGIVLAADQEAVLAKAHQWIAAHSHARQEPS
jgi:hypothetical protein